MRLLWYAIDNVWSLQFGTFRAFLEIDGLKYESASASAAKWSKSHANTSFLSEVIPAPTQRGRSIVYTFSNSPRCMNILQYADDTCLVANGPASCQQMLKKVEGWLTWTGMKAKVPKCFSLAIAASSGKRYDPALHLSGLHTHHQIPGCVPQTNRVQKNHLVEKLQQLLQRVEEVLVTRKHNLLLYKVGICPRLNWDLGVMDLLISWVKTTLEAMATRYLKRWSGLARAADPSRLYLPKMEGGLQLPTTVPPVQET